MPKIATQAKPPKSSAQMKQKVAKLPLRGVRAAAKEQSREALVKAAMVLFPTQGLDVSLDELCAHAGYTRGAFYQHFEDRDALIAEVTGRVADGLLSTITEKFSGESVRDLASIADTVVGIMQRGEYPIGRGGVMRSYQLLEACDRSDVVRQQYLGVYEKTRTTFAALVKRAQDEGRLPVHVSPDAAATLAIAMVVGLRTLHDLGALMDLNALLSLVGAGSRKPD